MANHPRRTGMRVDADGVRIVESGGRRSDMWLAIAIALIVGALIVIGRSALRGRAEHVATPPAGTATASESRAARPPAARPPAAQAEPDAGTRAPTLPAPRVRAKQSPAAEKDRPVPSAEAGEPSGIALFPPPGTKPVKRGIVVPEDFELPPGYVRHYQATDRGERVPAILMFHPDYEFVDARGEPIALPEDRVVPVELAPPGLPIQMLDVPGQGAPDSVP